MTTIIINEQTKAGKTLLELARILAASDKGVVIEMTEVDEKSSYSTEFIEKIKRAEANIKKGETTTVDQAYLQNLEKAAIEMKEISSGKRKGQTLQSFLDEL